MTISAKILAIAGTLLLLGLLTFTLYEVHAVSTRQTAIEQEVVAQKQLADNITRAMATWATKADLQQLSKDTNTNLSVIQKDLETLNANVTAMNVTTATSTAQIGTNLTSTGSVKDPGVTTTPATITCNGKLVSCPNQDPHSYLTTTQSFALNEEFGTLKVPFGTVSFNGALAAPWSQTIPQRQYTSVVVLGTDENQRIYAYDTLSIKTNNKTYQVPITSSQIKQIYPSPKFSLNPRLFLGFDAGVTVNNLPPKALALPNLTVQVASYGRYKTQPDLSILQLGAGYDIGSKRVDFLVAPVSYNIGKHLPLMNNLYVGPALNIGTDGTLGVTLGLKAAL